MDLISFLLLDWISKDTARWWLLGGEIALLIGSLVVIVGLIGESKDQKWVPGTSRTKLWKRLFVLMVVGGIVAELIADADIFSLSHRLQAIQDLEVANLNVRAEELRAQNLVLRKAVSPRRLLPTRRFRAAGVLQGALKLCDELPNTPGIKVFIQSIPDFDALNLEADFEVLLKLCHWQPSQIGQAETGVDPLTIPDGLTFLVEFKLEEQRNAAKAFAALLEKRDFESIPVIPIVPMTGGWPFFLPSTFPKDVIFIAIGRKPISALLRDADSKANAR
jgi:hypothetical protein